MINLTHQLTQIRENQGLTQQRVATKAGLSRMTVVRTENGQIDPRLSTLLVQARALGMELMLVPAELVQPLQEFVQSGGRYLGQQQGVEAPKSIVDTL